MTQAMFPALENDECDSSSHTQVTNWRESSR